MEIFENWGSTFVIGIKKGVVENKLIFETIVKTENLSTGK